MVQKGTEGATEVRARPVAAFPCPFCVEPVVVGQQVCDACGEPVHQQKPWRTPHLVGIGLGVYAALIVLLVLVGGRLGSALMRRPAAAAASASAAPAAPASSAASPSASAQPVASALPARDGGHLAGEVVGKMEIPSDAVDVLALPHDRIAVARKAAVEVLDARSGALAFTAADLPGVRALHLVGDALYGLGEKRIAIIDPDSVRARKWIDLGSAAGSVAVSSAPSIALLPLAEQSVTVIDTARHAEIERFHFDERVMAVDIDDRAGIAALAAPDAVLLIDPSHLAAAQPIRRVYVGDLPAAIAVAPSGAVVAAALVTSASLARLDLARGAPSVSRQKTCDEPMFARFVAASNLLLVGCRAGRAVAFHDASTLAEVSRIDLGGPAIGLDVSPDGLQALVAIGSSGASVGVIDLARRTLSRLSISDEIASARYGRTGLTAAAFAPRAHRVWVLR